MNIRVDTYAMTPSVLTVGTEGSYGIPRLIFDFSDEWEPLTKKVSFYTDTENYVLLLDEENSAVIPMELMTAAGEYAFAVSGMSGTDALVSLPGKLTVLPGREPAVTPPESPTPSEMAQIYALVEEAVTAANDATDAIYSAREASALARAAAETATAAGNNAALATEKATEAAASVVSVRSAEINADGHLILTLSNGNTVDTGTARGAAVTGSYSGSGSETQSILLGFRPALLQIARADGDGTVLPDGTGHLICGEGLSENGVLLVRLTEDGFTVSADTAVNEDGTVYRYVAFADNCEVLGTRLERKAEKPLSFTGGHLAKLTAGGDLDDSGRFLFDLAPSLKILTDAGTEHRITDSIGGSFSDAIFYGKSGQSAVPSAAAPVYAQSVENPTLTLTAASGTLSLSLGALTLRGLEVREEDDWNLCLENGETTHYYRSDTLSEGNTVTRQIGVYCFDGSESFRKTASGHFFVKIPDAAYGEYNPSLCSHFPTIPAYTDAALSENEGCGAMGNTFNYFYLNAPNYADAAALKAFLAAQADSGTPVTLLYLLSSAAKETFVCPDLSAVPLPEGTFTLRSDAPVCLCYGCDTETELTRRFALLEAALREEIAALRAEISG